MNEIAEAEERENEAAKNKKKGGGTNQQNSQRSSQEVVGSEERDYDDIVSCNFDNYQSFIKLTELIIIIFLFRFLT